MGKDNVLRIEEETMDKNELKNEFIPIENSKGTEMLKYPSSKEIIGNLSCVINAISNITGKDEAMIGQFVLSTLSASAQPNYKVHYFDEISCRPLSLFTLIIAESGGGKSTIANLCNEGLASIQRQKMASYRKQMAEYNATKDKAKLIKPVNPLFMVNGGTVEGISDVISRNGHCYALIDEAASFLGGYSGKSENILKTLGAISTLWSDAKITEVKRGNDDPIEIESSLSFCLCGQPEIIKPIFNNPIWRGQGAMPRFLVSEPLSIKTYRENDKKVDPKDKEIIERFNQLIKSIFNVAACTDGYYLVKADKEAKSLLTDFYNEMLNRAETDYLDIRSYANRATEQAARLSGILSLYNAFMQSGPVRSQRKHNNDIK